MKSLKVIKIVKEIKYEGVWGELKAKKQFPETIIHKVFETNSSFHVRLAPYSESSISIFLKFLGYY